MRISVEVKLHAREERLERLRESGYRAYIRAKPIHGSANLAVIELLAKAFLVAKSSITLVSGHRHRRKIFEVEIRQP